MPKFIYVPFHLFNYNGAQYRHFNQDLFKDSSASIIRNGQALTICQAKTPNFFLENAAIDKARMPEPTSSARIEKFFIYSDSDHTKTFGEICCSLNPTLQQIELTCLLEETIFYTELALELFTFFMFMMVTIFRNNSDSENYRVVCKFNDKVEPFLRFLISSVFNQLQFKIDNNIFVADFKIFKHALKINELLIKGMLNKIPPSELQKYAVIPKNSAWKPPPLFHEIPPNECGGKRELIDDDCMPKLVKKRHKIG